MVVRLGLMATEPLTATGPMPVMEPAGIYGLRVTVLQESVADSPAVMPDGATEIEQPFCQGTGGAPPHSPAQCGLEGHDAGTICKPRTEVSVNCTSVETNADFSPAVNAPATRSAKIASAAPMRRRRRMLIPISECSTIRCWYTHPHCTVPDG